MGQKPIDFAQLVRSVRAPKVGPEELSIWGGECSEDQLPRFIGQWPTLTRLTYRIWEYTSRIVIRKAGDAEDIPAQARVPRLERGRLFGGTGGDLSLRRDGDVFLWHFVGPAGCVPPEASVVRDFWQVGEPNARFHVGEESSLLWGERKEGFDRWFDDWVGSAILEYPMDCLNRVKVRYRTYSRRGRVEFVWLRELDKTD